MHITRMRTHFEGVIEVANFAKIVQELVDACLVVLNEGVQGDHICLLRI